MQRVVNRVHGKTVVNLFARIEDDNNIETLIEQELLKVYPPSDSMSLELHKVVLYLKERTMRDVEAVLQIVPVKICKIKYNNITRWIIILTILN